MSRKKINEIKSLLDKMGFFPANPRQSRIGTASVD
jgi:hypothetical protein